MQFASLSFLFFFLPITLIVYQLTPFRWKREVMLGISILFLLSGGLAAALIELLLTAGTFGAGLLLERLSKRKKRSACFLFGVAIIYVVALLLLRSEWMQSWETALFCGADFFPLGLGFFTLQGIGYCIDVHRGKCHAEHSWRQLFLYMLFYPRLIMGPVVSYPTAQKAMRESNFSIAQMGAGFTRLIIGLSKKLLLADWVGMLFQATDQVDPSGYSMPILWLGAFAHILSLYLELSGYADMAIGLALCYGVHLPESYGTTLFFPSIAKFAEHWNRTVVQWFSHYIGTRFHTHRQLLHVFAIMITWGCIGLWFGFRLPTFIWGVGMGLCIGLEHLIGKSNRYYGIRYTITTLLLCVGGLLLTLPNLPAVWEYLQGMCGIGRLAPSNADWRILREYGLALLVAAYAASGNWRVILRMIQEKSWFRRIRIPLSVLVTIALLFGCIAALICSGGTVEMQLLL